MNTYRMVCVRLIEVPVEVTAPTKMSAISIVKAGGGTQVGDETYRSSHIENPLLIRRGGDLGVTHEQF